MRLDGRAKPRANPVSPSDVESKARDGDGVVGRASSWWVSNGGVWIRELSRDGWELRSWGFGVGNRCVEVGGSARDVYVGVGARACDVALVGGLVDSGGRGVTRGSSSGRWGVGSCLGFGIARMGWELTRIPG
jgi:hypothetical protein